MNSDPTLSAQQLPESLTEIAEIIGLPSTLTLVEKWGGTRIFIPRQVAAQHKLANLLGFEQARKMSRHFGGETLTIARAANVIRSIRNREITRRYDEGEGVRLLAVEHNLTERQIYTILSQMV